MEWLGVLNKLGKVDDQLGKVTHAIRAQFGADLG